MREYFGGEILPVRQTISGGNRPMDEIWAKVLQEVRKGKNNALLALISSADDVEFTNFNIILRTSNDVEFNTLNKNLELLKSFAGGDYIIVTKKRVKDIKNNKYIERLRELFGEKLLPVRYRP